MESVRVDRWLWAVRLAKTRTSASTACGGGHVQINGKAAKPASQVRVGDRVQLRAGHRSHDVEVVLLLVKRVGAEAAAEALIDRSGPRAVRRRPPPPMVRERGAGRPTKKDRRAIDRLQGG